MLLYQIGEEALAMVREIRPRNQIVKPLGSAKYCILLGGLLPVSRYCRDTKHVAPILRHD